MALCNLPELCSIPEKKITKCLCNQFFAERIGSKGKGSTSSPINNK